MRHIFGRTLIHSMVLAVLLSLPSCESIFDNIDACPNGVSLRYVYDYNMEYANAFPSKVDCITLYVFDADGNYLSTFIDTSDNLADEDWRMIIDLEKGEYSLVAYGGIACDEATFHLLEEPSAGFNMTELSAEMETEDLTSSACLHNFFFGSLDVTVSEDDYQEETLYLVQDTNNLRILLQSVSGEALSADDFVFNITDDNSLFDYQNAIIPAGTVTYGPWSYGTETIVDDDDESTRSTTVTVPYAEFSMSRLWTENNARLVVTRAYDGETIINIPFIQYLLLLKSNLYSDMSDQEFLDRENDWSMLFYLGDGQVWLSTQIIINGWVVRLNTTSL